MTRVLPRALGIVCVVLVACAAAPPAPAPLAPDAALAQYRQRTLAALPAVATEPGAGWDIDRLTRAAWAFDAELGRRRWQLRQAEAELAQARRRPNPALTASAERSRDPDPGQSPWTLSAALEFTFETAGKRALRGEIAGYALDARRVALVERSLSVREQVRATRLALRHATVMQELAVQQAQLQARRAELIRHRWELGASARAEAERADDLARSAAAEREQALAAVQQARLALAAALSVPESALAVVQLAALPALPDSFDEAGWQDAALHDRLDLAQAMAEYRRADAELRLQVAQRVPDISLGPGLIFDQGQHRLSLASALLLPLFDDQSAAIDAAQAARSAAAQQVIAVQNAAFAELTDARAQLAAAQADRATQAQLAARAQAQTAAVWRRLQAGASDRLAVIDARLQALAQCGRLADAEARVFAAIGQVETVLQRPLWPPSALTAADYLTPTESP